jgi:membrane-associated protein
MDMDVLYYFVDLLANFDEHLTFWCANYGAWTIAILALIVFAETGLVVFPFLPGDSMLFIVGVFCGAGLLDYHAVVPALIAAAVLGDALNFSIGQRFGGALIRRSRHVAAGHAQSRLYFEKHGARTIVIARFVPVVRTFAPFAAGFGHMDRAVFLRYNVGGALLWVLSLTALGYVFGDLPVIRKNLSTVILSIVALSLLPLVWGRVAALRGRRSA